MTETLLQLALLSLWCHGWHHLFSPGEALYFISRGAYRYYEDAKTRRDRRTTAIKQWYGEQQNKSEEKDREPLMDLYNEKLEDNNRKFEKEIYILKPLFLCPICFASLYGTGGYLLLNYTTWGIFPVAIIALISVNRLTNKLL